MSGGISIVYWVIATIRIEIVRQQITVGAEQGGIVGRDETAYRRVIVTRLQVIPSGFNIVIITTVTNGIDVGYKNAVLTPWASTAYKAFFAVRNEISYLLVN